MDEAMLKNTLTTIAREYPDEYVSDKLRDIKRTIFNIKLALMGLNSDFRDPKNLSIIDLGGGLAPFSIGCAAMGFKRVILVDDFEDAGYQKVASRVFAIHKKYGVEVVSRDIIKSGVTDIVNGVDVVATFDSMEHWHSSPKTIFKQIASGLNNDGIFVLGVPNCVNLRKRITVPLGHGKWSAMKDWYEPEVFRGHVREPDVADLKYIAKDMGLTNVRIYGRNWQGHFSPNHIVRTATNIVDIPLRAFPSLCSDIYMVGCISKHA